MQTYDRIVASLQAFLASALHGGQWSASFSGQPGIRRIVGCVGDNQPVSGRRESNPGHQTHNLVSVQLNYFGN
jgi:hypothetical protein